MSMPRVLARSSRRLGKLSIEATSRCQYNHWTILQLTPEGFGKPQSAVGHMDLAVLSLVTIALNKVTNRWSELVDFLRTLLEARDSLLDPVRHDHLLFDTEDFSRSREYFWAINCLGEFESSISANIEQWEEFRRHLNHLEHGHRGRDNQSSASGDGPFNELIERSDAYHAQLKRYQRFFQDKRAATLALRDGVCKRLLTYMIVFNLNLIVRTCAESYRRYKSRLVSRMRNEEDETWKQRGECYDIFRPMNERRKPTEWLILTYVLRQLFLRPWGSMETLDADNSTDSAEAVATSKRSFASGTLQRIFNFRKREARPAGKESRLDNDDFPVRTGGYGFQASGSIFK
ncbi:MAG: hypothetical protein Q9163_000148 [Psora crenata]